MKQAQGRGGVLRLAHIEARSYQLTGTDRVTVSRCVSQQ